MIHCNLSITTIFPISLRTSTLFLLMVFSSYIGFHYSFTLSSSFSFLHRLHVFLFIHLDQNILWFDCDDDSFYRYTFFPQLSQISEIWWIWIDGSDHFLFMVLWWIVLCCSFLYLLGLWHDLGLYHWLFFICFDWWCLVVIYFFMLYLFPLFSCVFYVLWIYLSLIVIWCCLLSLIFGFFPFLCVYIGLWFSTLLFIVFLSLIYIWLAKNEYYICLKSICFIHSYLHWCFSFPCSTHWMLIYFYFVKFFADLCWHCKKLYVIFSI